MTWCVPTTVGHRCLLPFP